MMPLIDQQMESIDKMNARLTSLNQQLSSALNLYHDLMKESFLMEQMASMQIQSQSMNPYTAATGQPQFPMVNGVLPQSYLQQSQPQPTTVEAQPGNYYSQATITSTMSTPAATGSIPVSYGTQPVYQSPYTMPQHGVYQHSDVNHMNQHTQIPQMMMASASTATATSPGGQIMISSHQHHISQQSSAVMTSQPMTSAVATPTPQATAVPNLL